MTEYRRTHRTREKCERKGSERLQRGRRRIGGWEKQLREHQHRRRRIDVEIEKLDGRSREAGEQHAPRGVHDRLGLNGGLAHGLNRIRLCGAPPEGQFP